MDAENFNNLLEDGNDGLFAEMEDDFQPPFKRGRFEIPDEDNENNKAALDSGSVGDEAMICLNTKFGKKAFRGQQENVIRATLSGHDCLVIMGTGQGKSLCYQLPAALSDGVTVVVSPLKSLMFEQSVKMIKIGVPAAVITEGCSSVKIYSDLKKQQPDIKLLYITPEMLVHSKALKSTLDTLNLRRKLSRFVFDEVHCMESWGQDFRPEYRKLMWVHNSYPNIPFMALTATASPSTRLEIERLLGLKNVKRFISSVNRPNLIYSVLPKDKNCVLKMGELVKDEYADSCGIIYCKTREDCRTVSLKLTSEQISCRVYHAGLPKNVLESAHTDWLKGDVKVMVATNAFGMGIDKPDVRFVFHLHAPKCVQDYVQECGRAGRDGLTSKCILFYRFEDCLSWFSLSKGATNKNTSKTFTADKVKSMIKYATNVTDCRRVQLLSHFGEESPSLCSPSCCDNHLNQAKYITKDITKECRGVVNMLMPNYIKITMKQLKDVLKGSKQKTLQNRGFTNLRHHGMMATWRQNDVQNFLVTLFLNDILALKQEQGAYGVTNYVILGSNQSYFNDSFQLQLQVLSQKRNIIFNECMEKLVSVIDAFAFALGIEKSSIFDNKVLINMASIMPATVSEMMRIPGVTRTKYRQYGEPLLDVTQSARIQSESL